MGLLYLYLYLTNNRLLVWRILILMFLGNSRGGKIFLKSTEGVPRSWTTEFCVVAPSIGEPTSVELA